MTNPSMRNLSKMFVIFVWWKFLVYDDYMNNDLSIMVKESNVTFFSSYRVQILKPEYKYGLYCTPLGHSDCRYFFVLTISTSYHTPPSTIWSIFSKFLIFCDLFHDPLGEWNNSKIWKAITIFTILYKVKVGQLVDH